MSSAPTGPSNAKTLPLTYPDAVCFIDLDPLGRETTSDLQNLVQDVFHMLSEDPGSNPDDITRGIGVYQMLSGATQNIFPSLEKRIQTGLLKDDRITTAQATISALPDPAGVSYSLAIVIGVGTLVLGLSFSFSAALGLQFNSWQVIT